MKNSRRDFLKKSSMALAGATLFSTDLLAGINTPELVGVQLYSIRDDMKINPLNSLKNVAEMGYKNVEHANYIDRKFYGYGAKEFKKILDDLGLKMPSGHTVMRKEHWDAAKNDFTDTWKWTVDDAAILGQQIVISPWLDESVRQNYDDMKRYMEVFNKSGELCKKSGMRFGYHNHDFEFSQELNGKKIFDIILQNTDPKLVVQQLDIGNMYNAGAKALDIMKQYPGRFESMHVKDEIKATDGGHSPYESTILGVGVIPVKEIIDLGRKSGTKHFIIEQESYQGKTPMESIDQDFKIMKKWGY
ncbi:MAG: sugar phosphate isomerase/epimerase [Chitinophagaceae bacterium]|nr:sugar phosphate isomerase/epimerase [Chitinophagaceae bacterium]